MSSGSRLIKPDDELDLRKDFAATDSLLSFADIAFAGAGIAGVSETPQRFAAHVVALGHILTRIVLSERLVFLWDENDPGPWSTHVAPALREHCATVCISEDHPLLLAIKSEALDNPSSVVESSFVDEVSRTVKAYAPWVSESAENAWLAEYACADVLGLSIAPNPFLTQTYATHSIRHTSTAEELVRYTEDLRCEVTNEHNLLRRQDIYDLQVPAILSAVLRKSKTPNQMIVIASQMHEDARGFRDWCHDMDENPDPRKYNERVRSVRDELRRLGGAIGSKETERLHVSAPLGPGFSVPVPTPTFGKLLDKWNVDIGSSRKVRRFLLSLLTASRQVRSMQDELCRVFSVSPQLASEAADWLQILLEMEREHP